jgi:hypothetical protein
MRILKSNTLILSFSILFFNTSFAQEYFSGFYGGPGNEILNRIRSTRDGGYVMAGNTDYYGLGNSPVTNAYVIKTANNGTVEWSIAYGGASNHDDAADVQQTLDGGFIVSGWTDSYGPMRKAYLLKLDSTGMISWSKSYSNSAHIEADRILERPNGNFLIYGTVDTLNYRNIWIAETDASGNLLQSKWLYTGGDNYPGSIDTTSSGSFLFGGYFIPSSGLEKMVFFKMDNLLTTKWFVFGGNTINNSDRAYAIKEISNGDIVLGGGSSANEMNNGVYDYCLAKFDSSGNFIAARTYGQNGIYETGFDLAYNPVSHKLFLAGEISDLFIHALTIVADDQLDMQGPVHPGFGQTSFNNENKSIIQKPDGQLVIGGWSSETGSNDFFLALVDSNGASMPGCDYQSYGPYTMNYPQMSFIPPSNQPANPKNVTQAQITFSSATGVIYTPKCNTVSVPENVKQTLTIQSDYASGEIAILFPEAVENGTLTLYDVYGRKVDSKEITKGMHSTRISVERNGIYLVRFNGDNNNSSAKIIF